MKQPHSSKILEWLDERGISKYKFISDGSSAADKTFTALHKYLEDCLRGNQSDPTVKHLFGRFKEEMKLLREVKTEKKRCYVSTYKMENWDDNLINPERIIMPENNLDNLFKYWLKKIKKGDWSMRKYREMMQHPIKLNYELLNQKLKEPDFKIVR